MADNINDMKKFFIKLYEISDDPGMLTKRIMRQKYLDHIGSEKLTEKQEELFGKATLEAYEEFNQSEDSDNDFTKNATPTKKRKQTKADKRMPKRKKSKNRDSSEEIDDENDSENDFKPTKKLKKSSKDEKRPNTKRSNNTSQKKVIDESDSSDEEPLAKMKSSRPSEKLDDKLEKSKSEDSDQESSASNENKEKLPNEKMSETSPSKNDSDSESGSESQKSNGNVKNGKKSAGKDRIKSTNSKPTEKKESSDEKEDPKVEKMKGYVRAAGIRITNYSKYFEGCTSVKAKADKLLSSLKDAGLKGNPSLKACQELRKKRETAQEVAELDPDNIIHESSKRNRGPKKSRSNEKIKAPVEKPVKGVQQNFFSRLSDIVDCD